MNYKVTITSVSETPLTAPPASEPPKTTAATKIATGSVIASLIANVVVFLSLVGFKGSDGLPLVPPNTKVTRGPGYLHFDWPVAPAPAPIPGPQPQPAPAPPGPQPVPDPAPIPPPPPIVQPIATGQLHATLLLDPNNPSQPLAQLRSDLTIGGALEPFNCIPRAYLANESEAVANGYTALAKRYPCLIFQDRKQPKDDRAPVVSVIYPSSVAECVAEAKRLRGVN